MAQGHSERIQEDVKDESMEKYPTESNATKTPLCAKQMGF
jgi:hypothetical protein